MSAMASATKEPSADLSFPLTPSPEHLTGTRLSPLCCARLPTPSSPSSCPSVPGTVLRAGDSSWNITQPLLKAQSREAPHIHALGPDTHTPPLIQPLRSLPRVRPVSSCASACRETPSWLPSSRASQSTALWWQWGHRPARGSWNQAWEAHGLGEEMVRLKQLRCQVLKHRRALGRQGPSPKPRPSPMRLRPEAPTPTKLGADTVPKHTQSQSLGPRRDRTPTGVKHDAQCVLQPRTALSLGPSAY